MSRRSQLMLLAVLASSLALVQQVTALSNVGPVETYARNEADAAVYLKSQYPADYAALDALNAERVAAKLPPIKPPPISKPGEGFPRWYQDDAGVTCALCLKFDPQGTGTCLSTWDGLGSIPGAHALSFPDEMFYYALSAAFDYTWDTGVADPKNPGQNIVTTARVRWENAVEGAYATGGIQRGQEMVFQRTRIVIDCPDEPGTYTFKLFSPHHPDGLELPDGVVPDDPKGANGARCVFFTIDAGITPLAFTENFKEGPIKAFMKASSPTPTSPAGQEYGNFPNLGAQIDPLRTGSTPQFALYSNIFNAKDASDTTGTKYKAQVVVDGSGATLDRAGDGDRGKVSTTLLQSSCHKYTGSLAVITRTAVVATGSTLAVDVFVSAPASEAANLIVSYKGKSKALVKGTSSIDPPCKFSANCPVSLYARLEGIARADVPGNVVLTYSNGASVETQQYPVAAELDLARSSAVFTGTKLLVNAFTTDSTDVLSGSKITLCTTAADGTLRELAVSTNTTARKSRRLLAPSTGSEFDGKCSGGEITATSVPEVIMVCRGAATFVSGKKSTDPELIGSCWRLPVKFDSSFSAGPTTPVKVDGVVSLGFPTGTPTTGTPVNLVATVNVPLDTDWPTLCSFTLKQTNGPVVTPAVASSAKNVWDFTPTQAGDYTFTVTMDCGSNYNPVSSSALVSVGVPATASISFGNLSPTTPVLNVPASFTFWAETNGKQIETAATSLTVLVPKSLCLGATSVLGDTNDKLPCALSGTNPSTTTQAVDAAGAPVFLADGVTPVMVPGGLYTCTCTPLSTETALVPQVSMVVPGVATWSRPAGTVASPYQKATADGVSISRAEFTKSKNEIKTLQLSSSAATISGAVVKLTGLWVVDRNNVERAVPLTGVSAASLTFDPVKGTLNFNGGKPFPIASVAAVFGNTQYSLNPYSFKAVTNTMLPDGRTTPFLISGL